VGSVDFVYTIKYHPAVKREDIPKLSQEIRSRIKKAIETKLAYEPEKYGIPLRGTLKKYWKLKVGDYRIVFKVKVKDKEVIILGIRHRKDIYKYVNRRTSLSFSK